MNDTPSSPDTSPACPFHASQTDTSTPHEGWPPGPSGRFGGLFLLRDMSQDLLGTLARWQADFGDLVHLRIWPEHEVMVCDPHLVRELLVTHHDALVRWERGIRAFSRSQGHSVLIAEGDAWRNKRRVLQPSFSHRAARSMLPSMVEATTTAHARWSASLDELVVEEALTTLTVEVISRLMFTDDPGEDSIAIQQAVHDVQTAINRAMYLPFDTPDWLPWNRRRRDALRLLRRMIDRQIHHRLARPRADWPDDLLGRLLILHIDDPSAWSRKSVSDECMTAFAAGHETTAATLIWWMWCMAAHPHEQQRVHDEIRRVLGGRAPTDADIDALPLLMQSLQETLRLFPAAPVLITRRATRPITLGGYAFPARTLFVIPMHLMHRDARWFPEPTTFQPNRFTPGTATFPRGAYMPFGAGPRVCLGQAQAMTELMTIAAMALQRFAVSLPENSPEPRPVFTISLRPDKALSLRLTART